MLTQDILDGIRDGETFDVELDMVRLNSQARKVYTVMYAGAWMTLREIAALADAPEASVSARLRDFRKERFGGHTVERRRRANTSSWEYRLVLKGDK